MFLLFYIEKGFERDRRWSRNESFMGSTTCTERRINRRFVTESMDPQTSQRRIDQVTFRKV